MAAGCVQVSSGPDRHCATAESCGAVAGPLICISVVWGATGMHGILPAEMAVSTGFVVIATLAILAQSLVLFVAFFGPGLRYKISPARGETLDSPEFLYQLEALTDAKLNRHTTLEVLTNGESFYPAELEAIRAARRSVNLENYIFQRGKLADQFIAALNERARAGVRVNVVLDA